MPGRIGSDLNRARTRREIDLSEVEAATRIRTRFLTAMESEDWDALPGGVYTRGFIRTYASYLGLDGERLAEDYRREVEAEAGLPPSEGALGVQRQDEGRGGRRGSRLGWVALAIVALLAAIAVFVIPQDDGGGGAVSPRPAQGKGPAGEPGSRPPTATAPKGISIRLAAEAEVWACVLAASGRHLVDGQILQAGAEAGPFRSDSFTLSFGNGEVTMTIDGKQAEIPPTSSPIGYAIDPAGRLEEISDAERPTCE